jgi:hypothetical protein
MSSGDQSGSQGAILVSDALKTPVMILAAGPNVRVTGLRLRGPNGWGSYLDFCLPGSGPQAPASESEVRGVVSSPLAPVHEACDAGRIWNAATVR